MIDKRAPGVKGKTKPILTFNRFLFGLFSLRYDEYFVVPLCINHRLANMFGGPGFWWNSAILVAPAPALALALSDSSAT
jgi:hypothetical protein